MSVLTPITSACSMWMRFRPSSTLPFPYSEMSNQSLARDR
jgi:hypothetical protein